MATRTDLPRHRIVLANEPGFRLGALDVSPSSRQVMIGGESETLEPRVMQALVVLGLAQGTIVGRDELIDRCWDGRVVGENAINRVVSLLRALAARTGAFSIETINKVGYRLTAVETAAQQAGDGPASTEPPPTRRRAMIGGIAAIVAGGAAVLLWPRIDSRRSEAERAYRAAIESERLGQAGLDQALLHYRAAVKADPGYSAAWGGLARALGSIIEYRPDDDAMAHRADAEEAITRALRLDPRNADALLARVMTTANYRNWYEFQRLAVETLRIRPDLVPVRLRLAQLLADTGRLRSALGETVRAIGGQPFAPRTQVNLGWLLWQTGDVRRADMVLARAIRIWPGDDIVWASRTMFLSMTGRTAEALAMEESSRIALAGPIPPPLAMLFARALASGAPATLRGEAITALTSARAQGDIASFLSIPYVAALGDISTAFEQSYTYLLGARDRRTGERHLARRAARRTDFLFSTATAPMRADARFAELTETIGLGAYWRRTGSRPDPAAS